MKEIKKLRSDNSCKQITNPCKQLIKNKNIDVNVLKFLQNNPMLSCERIMSQKFSKPKPSADVITKLK